MVEDEFRQRRPSSSMRVKKNSRRSLGSSKTGQHDLGIDPHSLALAT
jgi:hypothetical protein